MKRPRAGIVVLAKERFGLRARDARVGGNLWPFTAQTRMSGIDLHTSGNEPINRIRKGAAEAVRGFVDSAGGAFRRAFRNSRGNLPPWRDAARRRFRHGDPRRD